MSTPRPSFRAAAAQRLAEDGGALPAAVEGFLSDTRRMAVRMLPIRLVEVPVARRDASADRPMLESLIASIREHGVLEPILVRPLGGRGFEVVAGERRLRAARLAGLEVIPAVVREMDDSTAAALAADRATGELPKPHAPAPKSGIRPDPPAGGPTTVARAFDAGRPRSVTNGTYMPPAVVTRREPRVISGPGIPGPGAFEPADGGAGMPGEVPVAAGDERSRRPRFRFAPFPFLRRERGSSERQR